MTDPRREIARAVREQREAAKLWRAGDRFEWFQVEAWLLEECLIGMEGKCF